MIFRLNKSLLFVMLTQLLHYKLCNEEAYFHFFACQIVFHHNLTMKALFNPENLFNRQALNKGYGLVLPKIGGARQAKVVYQSVNNYDILK